MARLRPGLFDQPRVFPAGPAQLDHSVANPANTKIMGTLISPLWNRLMWLDLTLDAWTRKCLMLRGSSPGQP